MVFTDQLVLPAKDISVASRQALSYLRFGAIPPVVARRSVSGVRRRVAPGVHAWAVSYLEAVPDAHRHEVYSLLGDEPALADLVLTARRFGFLDILDDIAVIACRHNKPCMVRQDYAGAFFRAGIFSEVAKLSGSSVASVCSECPQPSVLPEGYCYLAAFQPRVRLAQAVLVGPAPEVQHVLDAGADSAVRVSWDGGPAAHVQRSSPYRLSALPSEVCVGNGSVSRDVVAVGDCLDAHLKQTACMAMPADDRGQLRGLIITPVEQDHAGGSNAWAFDLDGYGGRFTVQRGPHLKVFHVRGDDMQPVDVLVGGGSYLAVIDVSASYLTLTVAEVSPGATWPSRVYPELRAGYLLMLPQREWEYVYDRLGGPRVSLGELERFLPQHVPEQVGRFGWVLDRAGVLRLVLDCYDVSFDAVRKCVLAGYSGEHAIYGITADTVVCGLKNG